MKCPLFDENNNRRTLDTIEFGDFRQLEEIEEGYTVEYKCNFDKDVRKKMPKEMASFANASGGWIFVGVDDDGKYVGIQRERADFDQILAQIIHRNIEPFPRFETRFVSDPKDSSGKGVLVIEVQEGYNPPYIANGNVFIRVGSSSEYMEKADSFALIDLYRKGRRYRKEINHFCHRDVYFPPLVIRDGKEVSGLPIFNLYMKRIVAGSSDPIDSAQIDETIQLFKKIFMSRGDDTGFCCQHSYHSLLFRERLGVVTDDAYPVIELFYDGSMKVAAPMYLAQSGQGLEALLEDMQRLRPIRNINLAKIIYGRESLGILLWVCKIIDDYLCAISRSSSEYAFCIECENMEGSFVYFDTDEYREYVKTNGFLNIGTLDEKTRPYFPDEGDADCIDDNFVQSLVWLFFVEGLGLPSVSEDEESRERLNKLMGLAEKEDGATDE